MSRLTANLLLLFVGAIWGMGFIAQSVAMDHIEPLFYTGIRFLAAAFAVLPFAIWEGRKIAAKNQAQEKPDTAKPFALLPAYFLLGSILFGALVTQQIGLITTTVTNSGFLTSLYVVLTPLLAIALFRQKPHFIVWPAVTLTSIGIYLLSGSNLSALTHGDYWTLAGAVLWSFHVLVLGRVMGRKNVDHRPFMLASSQFFVCAFWGIGLAFIFETPTFTNLGDAAFEILFAGVISGGAAFSLQAVAQQYTTAPQAALFMSSEALFAALFGAIFLAERIPPIGLIGCGFIFAALLLVELVPLFMGRNKKAKTDDQKAAILP